MTGDYFYLLFFLIFYFKNKVMKKKKSYCDYIESRNEALRREIYSRLGTDGHTAEEVFRAVARRADAPRFFINEERAITLIRHFRLTGAFQAGIKPIRKRMIQELNRRVESLLAEHPAISLREAVYRAVNSRAPSYYISWPTIKTLFFRS